MIQDHLDLHHLQTDFGLFPEMQGTNKKGKRFTFGKVDLALKSQIYFEGFAFPRTIVS